MKLNFNKAQCFTVPEKLYQLINNELSKASASIATASAITLNFRNPNYSSRAGGFHPVEIRIVQSNSLWQLSYITDFSYQGEPMPELVKEIDVCFSTKRVTSLFDGELNYRQSNMLFKIFTSNFIEYHAMGVYRVSIHSD